MVVGVGRCEEHFTFAKRSFFSFFGRVEARKKKMGRGVFRGVVRGNDQRGHNETGIYLRDVKNRSGFCSFVSGVELR